MIPHYRTLVTSLLLFLSSTFAFAQDADEQYAKDLLKPGTEAPDFPLQSKGHTGREGNSQDVW